jgi:hypothetical protein
MTTVRVIAWVCVVTSVVSGARNASAQGRRTGGPATTTTGQFIPFERRNSDPLAGPVVTGAPFSADATTSVVQTLGDGTRIEQKSMAKYYRDGTGRVRREQTVLGLENLNAAAARRTIITLDSVPGDQMPYLLDPENRTARQMPRGIALSNAAGALSTFRLRTSSGNGAGDVIDVITGFQGLTVARRGLPNDLRAMEEDLGSRQIDGIKAVGNRRTTTIPQGQIGNDRPIQITDEQWYSPELNILISSRYSDPRTGVVEYRLTNIVRSEPRADLFVVPPDYTVVQGLTLAPGGRGGRNAEPGSAPRGGRK